MCKRYFGVGLALTAFGVGVLVSKCLSSVLFVLCIGAACILTGLILMKKK